MTYRICSVTLAASHASSVQRITHDLLLVPLYVVYMIHVIHVIHVVYMIHVTSSVSRFAAARRFFS